MEYGELFQRYSGGLTHQEFAQQLQDAGVEGAKVLLLAQLLRTGLQILHVLVQRGDKKAGETDGAVVD